MQTLAPKALEPVAEADCYWVGGAEEAADWLCAQGIGYTKLPGEEYESGRPRLRHSSGTIILLRNGYSAISCLAIKGEAAVRLRSNASLRNLRQKRDGGDEYIAPGELHVTLCA